MDAMLSRMTSEQLDEWIAANELDHLIGLEKLYAQLALIATALVNSWGGKTETEMFIPKYETKRGGRPSHNSESADDSPNQMAAIFGMFAAQRGWVDNGWVF